jgi:hypothetical protein
VNTTDNPVDVPTNIISISAEGGSIYLRGIKTSDGEWKCSRAVGDQTASFLSDDDGAGLPMDSRTEWVSTWSEALILLDRYPWAMPGASDVHPEFREQVWTEVTRRLRGRTGARANRARAKWIHACTRVPNR